MPMLPVTRRTPLAWKNLVHDRRRFLLAVGGIGFAVLLMCMQLSFQRALFDSTLALIDKLNADLVITSEAKYTIIVREPFTRRRLFQALASPLVADAWPMYIETTQSLVINPETGEGLPIRVLAFDPGHPVLNIPEVAEHVQELRLPQTALYDRKSKPEYGPIRAHGPPIKLANHSVQVVGYFSLGTDFANDGNMIVSDVNYRTLFVVHGAGENVLGDVDVGVVKLKPGVDPSRAKQDLVGRLPNDVTVRTKEEFKTMERHFWETSTPIGYIFWLGTTMGFVVGVVICYQVLYADIDDHMAEFATLKAMGYPNIYFVGVVLQEAVLLAVLGLVPGILVSMVLCGLVTAATGLLVAVGESTALLVLALSVMMCVVSGCLAMRKLMSSDPAELF